jgi:hypothetical protein
MAPEQLHLDFSAGGSEAKSVLSPVANVVDLRSVRMAKQRESLTSVYQSICDSVRHIRLNRHSTGNAKEAGSSRF